MSFSAPPGRGVRVFPHLGHGFPGPRRSRLTVRASPKWLRTVARRCRGRATLNKGCFRAVSRRRAAQSTGPSPTFARHGVEIEVGPVVRQGARGEGTSVFPRSRREPCSSSSPTTEPGSERGPIAFEIRSAGTPCRRRARVTRGDRCRGTQSTHRFRLKGPRHARPDQVMRPDDAHSTAARRGGTSQHRLRVQSARREQVTIEGIRAGAIGHMDDAAIKVDRYGAQINH